MANSYTSTPVLSKIELGGNLYYLKDADVRTIIDAYGTIVSYNAASTVGDNEDIPTGKAIITYINSAVAGLAGAMHFVGGVDSLPDSADAYSNGDVIVVTGTGKEYVVLESDGVKSFVELGDEAGHVHVDRTIAGIDLKDDITVAELQSALALKALAYKDSASATLDDYATGITGAAYTPAGTVSVATSENEAEVTSTGSFTPTGTVSGTVTPQGSVALAADTTNGTQITGTVNVGTVTVTPTTATIKQVTSTGTLPTFSSTSGTYATAGLVGSVADETLTLTAASTAAGVATATYVQGALPSTSNATVVTGISGASATATFTGDKFGVTFTGASSDLAATFKGTAGSVSVSGNYDKVSVDSASFSGTQATITPTLAKGTKTITVS